MKELDPLTVESSEFVEQTFNFWFNTRNHIRSPFPEYIRPDLKRMSIDLFFKWASGIDSKAKEEINDTIIAEKFEEIIFDTAYELVRTEDEKITIKYPFLPRSGDEIKENSNDSEKSFVIKRWFIKEKDNQFLKVRLEKQSTKEIWETKFELPV